MHAMLVFKPSQSGSLTERNLSRELFLIESGPDFKRPKKGKSKSAKIGRYENDAKQQPDPTIMISNKFLIDSAVAMI